jgi:hypothetical protein
MPFPAEDPITLNAQCPRGEPTRCEGGLQPRPQATGIRSPSDPAATPTLPRARENGITQSGGNDKGGPAQAYKECPNDRDAPVSTKLLGLRSFSSATKGCAAPAYCARRASPSPAPRVSKCADSAHAVCFVLRPLATRWSGTRAASASRVGGSCKHRSRVEKPAGVLLPAARSGHRSGVGDPGSGCRSRTHAVTKPCPPPMAARTRMRASTRPSRRTSSSLTARPSAALATAAWLKRLTPRAAVSARANRWCSRSIRPSF